MESIIYRKTTARIVGELFEKSTVVNIRYSQLQSEEEITEGDIDTTYLFKIKIRHNDNEDPIEVFEKALKELPLQLERPYHYFILDNITKKVVRGTNVEPRVDELFTWEDTADPKVKEKRQTRTAYVDTRYPAKLRLFNYIQNKLK